MKKMLLLLLLFCQFGWSQDTKRVTVVFNNVTREDAIEKIESASGLVFYFDPSWLEGTELVSGSFQDQPIASILSALFENTTLNFYIDGDKVILTRNSLIRELPNDFFQPAKTPETQTDKLPEPVFTRQYDSIARTTQKAEPIALIGKETTAAAKKIFAMTGQIKDKKTGAPLANVNVTAVGQNSSAITDENGFYTLNVPAGMHTIAIETVSHERYTRKIMVYSDGKLDATLSEKVNLLDEVVVKANRDKNVRAAVSGVTTIETEAIKNIPLILGERDILRVATAMPGVKTAGEGSAGYNVRGGKEDQNLILLDNALLYNPAHFFGFFSALNPFTTKKVDIYKGSIPAEFGGRLSSVFDITTKNGNYDKIAGEGGVGPVTSNLSLSVPIVKGKSSVIVGGRATYSDWILKSLEEESLKNSQASFYDAIVKYSHKIDAKNTVEGTAYYSRDAFSITSDSVYKYTNRVFSTKWDHTFNDKTKGALILTNSEYQFNIDYQTQNPDAFYFGYKLAETQAIAKATWQYNLKHKFGYGISSKLYGVHPGDLNPKTDESPLVPVSIEKERGLESAAFITDNYKINEKLAIDIGLRYSVFAALGKATQRVYEPGLPISDATVVDEREYGNNEVIKTYGGLEPRIAARYFLTEDLSVKAGYDKSYQYIHLLSSNTTQSPTDTWKLSDLNVKPQRSEQFSLGLYKNFKNDLYELSVEGYYKRSKNILDYKVAAELLLKDNVETELLQGEGKAYGVEILLKKSEGRLNGWLGYTYSRALLKLDSRFDEERVNNGEFFAANFDKPHDVSAVLNYKLTKRYSLSANFIYQTGRPITYPIGTYVYNGAEYTLYSDRNKFRIPDYYRLDLGINIEGNHKIKKLAHSFWNISVYNVLGRNNPYSVYFVTENGRIKGYKTSIFAIPVPTITYNFKF
jgi:hypothetical protein